MLFPVQRDSAPHTYSFLSLQPVCHSFSQWCYFVYYVQGICLWFDVIPMIRFKRINRCTVNCQQSVVWVPTFFLGQFSPSSVSYRNCLRPDSFRCVFNNSPTVCERHISTSTRNSLSQETIARSSGPFYPACSSLAKLALKTCNWDKRNQFKGHFNKRSQCKVRSSSQCDIKTKANHVGENPTVATPLAKKQPLPSRL